MTTNSIISQDHLTDKIIFTARGWLNWAVIQRAIARENLRRWPASWLADVAACGVVTLVLTPAWAAYRLGALVGRAGAFVENVFPKAAPAYEIGKLWNFHKKDNSEPYATIPVGDTLTLEIRTDPPALVIRKNGAALEVEPNELMALAGALTVAGGGLPELMKTKGILWEN